MDGSVREAPWPEADLSRGGRLTSGLTSRLVLNYVEREIGAGGASAVLEQAGLTEHEARLRDPTLWFDFETKKRLFQAAEAVVGRPNVAWDIGRSAIELQSLAGLKVALRAFGSPRLAYGAVPSVSGRFTRAHRLEIGTLGEESARFRYFDVSGSGYHEFDCSYTQGLLSCVSTMFGEPPARVRHRACALHGAPECIYDVQWSTHRGRGTATALTVAAGAAGLVAATRRSRRALLAPALGAAVAGHRRYITRRQVRRSLETELRDQEEAAERLSSSLRDLVSDLRTDEVLRKIMENAQAALLGREIAVIATAADADDRAHGSSRIPESAMSRLEAWAGSAVDLTEPMTLPSLYDVPELADLPRHPDAPLSALSAAPLTFRGERLGVLVALAPGPEPFLPKETALLEIYAAEAAIALANARLVERLEGLARRDSLTGLLNHGEFQEALSRALERAQRRRERVSVLLVDLDGFKEVNDEYGHAEGDRVLRMVADKIRGACTGAAEAARIGGDEFGLILPGRTASEAEAVAAHLEREIVSFGLGTGASWGVAEWPTSGPSQSLLLFNADRALYDAKMARRLGARHAARRGAPESPLAADHSLTAADHRRGLTAALARAVDAKDSYTRSHCETVAELCAAIGHELELEARRVLKLRLAGLLHDVGKIGIADAILQKPDRLTDEEFEVMKTHTTLGHSILYAAELFEEAQWVLHHHERLDGRGYPDGLPAGEIPLESRIILVADAFEAMTSDRPYRKGRPEAEAVAELRRHAGTQFDPECVGALTRVLERDPRWSAGAAVPAKQPPQRGIAPAPPP